MICDECGAAPATVHLTTITNGERKERKLCGACLAKLNKLLISGELAGLLSGLLAGPQQAAERAPAELACSRCGRTFDTFQKTGLLGCAQCYRDFREYVEPVLHRIHGHTQHEGRAPLGEDGAIAQHRQLESLKSKLREAISAEEYEQAAKLRDQIKALREATALPVQGGEPRGT